MAPSGPTFKSLGRKFWSVPSSTVCCSVPLKLAPLSSILYRNRPRTPITFGTIRFPCQSSGKCRLDR